MDAAATGRAHGTYSQPSGGSRAGCAAPGGKIAFSPFAKLDAETQAALDTNVAGATRILGG